MIVLRPPQKEAIDFAVTALNKPAARALAQLPTGSGKSLVKLFVAMEWLRRGRRVLLLTPSNLTLSKLYTDARTLGMKVAVDWNTHHAKRDDEFVIATYQTAWNRFDKHIRSGTLLILDEAHHINIHAEANQAIYHSFAHVFGVSASPWSPHCEEFFPLRHRYSLRQAIADGLNCEFEILPYCEVAIGKFQIMYCPTNQMVKETAQVIPHGDWVLCERDDSIAVIRKFREGKFGTMVVNRKLTEGFDLPAVKRIWITRETISPILAYQMLGRALRPYQGQRAQCFIQHPKTRKTLETALTLAG